jgi:ATP-dependent helicase/nuclease subunit A
VLRDANPVHPQLMPAASPEQLKAADPRNSVWVSANAGSGKTTVLTARVVRLLLAGAEPSRILCVTFTKAAAANMQNKIFEALGAWVALDDAGLAQAITTMTGEPPRAGDLPKARRLFARAVETPGGLKIQTIHGFCERLLHLFPFEAGVPARFKVLDDVEQGAITEAAITATLNAALADAGGTLGQALLTATAAAGEGGFREALREFMKHRRDRVLPSPERKFAHSPLRQRLRVAPGETAEGVEHKIISEGPVSASLQEIHDWLAGGSKSDKDAASALKAALAFKHHNPHPEPVEGSRGALPPGDDPVLRQAQDEAYGDTRASVDIYVGVFLTDKGGPRASLATKKLREERPDLAKDMLDEQRRILALVGKINAITTAERSEAIILLADAVNTRYRAQKRLLGRLDFPDLIGKVAALLSADTAQWVLYKLDQGLDHVLVDEAQDTSPEQWTIVKAIADDFFAGEGARAQSARNTGLLQRTIFAVGDEKQSIFGFQGAKPEEFDAARRHFRQRIAAFNQAAGEPHHFEDVPLRTSYRTTDDVLKLVDQVFSLEAHYRGLSSVAERTVHVSNRLGAPGFVELWAPEVGEKTEQRDASQPVDSVPAEAPSQKLARRIARRIRHWSETGARFEDDGRRITPGDILILVRNRGAIFNGVIKALKQQGVPVAGADRMKLKEQIAVLDLLALGRFVLLPEDDLNLAALLKSPLIGLAEEDLLTLANGRGLTSLWASLQAKAALEPRLTEAVLRLSHWQALAGRLDPYAFYMHCLSVDGVRRRLSARLGPDAEEAMTVFLAQLRQWQASHPPSLLGFIEAMAASETDVKRDMEEAHGRVRVMTVHASKGLEARIVILADLFHKPAGKHGPRLIEIEAGDPDSAVWSPSKNGDPDSVAEAKDGIESQSLAESRRLLYVALTRARDRLYIAGARSHQKPPEQNWHSLVEAALAGHAHATGAADEAGEGTVLQWRTVVRRPMPIVQDEAAPAAPSLPDWLHQPITADLPRPPPLRPSRIADAAEPPPLRETAAAKINARLRGDLIHHLLQHLPDVAADRRPAIARALAQARFPGLADAAASEAIASTLALMADPRLAILFTGEARAEADIAGRVTIGGQDLDVAGRMDRLAITPDRVMLVDYKTGRPPRDPGDVPASHLAQLAVYDALLRDLYPGRSIDAAIVWTALPAVVILPPSRLAQALSAIRLA